MNKQLSMKHVFGSALLVAGTSVGAGMLALPVMSAEGGFFPSILIYFICYVVMTISGLYYAEISIKMPKDTNIIHMSSHYLGKGGKCFAWVLYLFLFYSLCVAYISGGADFVVNITDKGMSQPLAVFVFVIILATFVYMGAQMVDRINWVLMGGLVFAYIAFVTIGAKFIQTDLLKHLNWSKSSFAIPVVLVSFGYQGLVPSLTNYLQKDKNKIRLAIIIGTTVTFVIYLIWNFLIMGIIPLNGESGLISAKLKGVSAVDAFQHLTNSSLVFTISQFFSFFAITTSFLGVSLGLFDFLSDGFKLSKKGLNKVFLALLTFCPPVLISLVNPGVFLTALNYAGGIGGALLLVFLPTLLVYVARYKRNDIKSNCQLFTGKKVVYFVFIFSVLELLWAIRLLIN